MGVIVRREWRSAGGVPRPIVGDLFGRKGCNTLYIFDCWSDENDLRCATGTPATGAQIKNNASLRLTALTYALL